MYSMTMAQLQSLPPTSLLGECWTRHYMSTFGCHNSIVREKERRKYMNRNR